MLEVTLRSRVNSNRPRGSPLTRVSGPSVKRPRRRQMVRTAQFKLNVYDGVPGELYDVEHDPREFHNLIADPSHNGTVALLVERLRIWERENRF